MTGTPARPLGPRALASRAAILEVASRQLATTGDLDVSKVAAEAGVSAGLPYHYFGTRGGLLAAVVDDFHLRLSEAVVYRDLPGRTWQERERQRVRAWVRFLFRDPLAPVLLSGVRGEPEVAAAWQRRLELAIEVGARNIGRAQRDGDLPADRDPTLLAAAVLGGVESLVATALRSTPRPSEAAVARAAWSFVGGASGSPDPEEPDRRAA